MTKSMKKKSARPRAVHNARPEVALLARAQQLARQSGHPRGQGPRGVTARTSTTSSPWRTGGSIGVEPAVTTQKKNEVGAGQVRLQP